MLFVKALRRDLTNLAGVVFAALFTIMVTVTLIRILGRAAVGTVDTQSVLPLIAFAAVNFLPILLVLTLYVAILMSLTRAYRDSEMVIWFASGRSILDWIAPVLRFALPFVILIGLISLGVAPWAARQSSEYQKRFEQREDVSQVSAGQFRESGSGGRVFFVESISEDQAEVRNVFVTQRVGDEISVVVSGGGGIQILPNGDRFLVLNQGRRYDSAKGEAAFRIMSFERYGVRLDPQSPDLTVESTRARSTWELITAPTLRHQGELMWRLSVPISAVVLALMAIPLSAFNPRVGRSINLVLALLVYVVYNNFLSITQAWIGQGKADWMSAALVHLIPLGLVALMFYWRVSLIRVPWLQRVMSMLRRQQQ
jgi:lipopolysaccharide export system permease protein